VASAYVQSLRTLFHGTAKPLPAFKASFSPGACLLTDEGQTATQLNGGGLYGAVVASYGLHATLVADSDTIEYRKHGNKRFELVAKDLLFPADGSAPHAYQARVVLDRKEIERKEHGYVLATLVSNLENTFTISPASTPLDGKLKVVHFAARGGIETMEIMKAAYNCGKHTEMKEVGYEGVTKLRIEVNENGPGFKWRRFCIDGLIVRVEEGGWMEVEMVEGRHETISIVVDTD
jgi:diacylglycerol kinase family enzyme